MVDHPGGRRLSVGAPSPYPPPIAMSSPRRPLYVALALALLAGGGALTLSHCAPRGGARTGGDVDEADLVAGAQLYRTYCGLCHGDEGEGYAADNANALANQQFLASVTDEFLRVNIARGHPGTPMASYARTHGGPLSSEEVDQLVAFIRSWQEVPPADLPAPGPGDAERAEPIYAAQCASCHGDEGEGVTAVSLNHPVFLATASDAQIRYAIAKGREGTPMPAFEERLTAQQIDDLTALLRSWEPEEELDEDAVAEPAAVTASPVIHPDGEAPDFPELREGRYVPAAEVARALQDGRRMVILDARPTSDYTRFHVPGAVPSPYYDLERVKEHLPRDGTWILAYCGCPHAASGRVMDHLRAEGFENTAVIDEGVFHWRDEGYPVVVGPEPGTLADAE